nr:putative ribonuclease H-like domain-containing protein [Tanacetum cinerariifolium]
MIFVHKRGLKKSLAMLGLLSRMVWVKGEIGKFEPKGDEGYFFGYSMSSKAFRVFNKRTKRVEENVHIEFLENKAIENGSGPNWLFDIDSLTKSMNYVPVVDAGTNSTNFSGTKVDARKDVKKDVSSLRYIVLPNWVHEEHLESISSQHQEPCNTDAPESSGNSNPTATLTNPLGYQVETLTVESPIPTVSSSVPTVCFTDSQEPSSETRLISKKVTNQVETPSLDDILTLTNQFEDTLGGTTNSEESNGVEADVSNMKASITASPTPTLRIHKDHPKSQIIGPVDTLIQTRNKSKEVGEQSFIAIIHQKTDPSLLQFCLFSCFLSQVKPKKISDALQYPSWVEAMQEELLQFKIQNVWTLVDCPKGVRPIGTKWVLKNKKEERGIVIRNKARLVAQGHTQEEGIDYDEVFTPVARIEAIRLFLAYASFMDFVVYQMDVKSAFLYGTIDEEVYVIQPPGFQDPDFPAKVYKVEKAMYGLHQAPRAWYTDVRSSNTPIDKENPWGKEGTGKDVDLHLYKSMIGSLMYLTASRPDIMFVVCACTGHQVTPKECHLHAVKRIFRYLKGHPKLGLWYPKDSPFDLVSFSDSDYGGATQDRKSTTGGCQFLGTYKFWGVLIMLMISLRLILLGEHNSDFHPMVDFLEASLLRRNLKLRDEDGISSLPDAELFENLTLMGYNISTNQKFTFPKAPWVTSPVADEGKILKLRERVKVLEDREGIAVTRSEDDAPIKGRNAATVLARGIDDVPTGSGSIPTAGPPAADIPTGSEVVPTAIIRNNLGWKIKDFKGMTFEEVEAKFNSVCKQMEDFIPMGSKEEAERYKRKAIRFTKKDIGAIGRSSGWEEAQLVISSL